MSNDRPPCRGARRNLPHATSRSDLRRAATANSDPATRAVEFFAGKHPDGAVVAVLSDGNGEPVLCLTVKNAPSDDVCAVADLLGLAAVESDWRHAGWQVVVGIVRGTPAFGTSTEAHESLIVSASERSDWADAIRRLEQSGFSVVDLVVVDGDRWASVRTVLGPPSH